MKKNFFYIILLAFVLDINTPLKAQITPLFTNSVENGIVDEATGRLFINDVAFLPNLDNYAINKNVRNWAKDFFNSNTGITLTQESEKNYQLIEYYYRNEFQKKTTPQKETMGISAPLLYSNKNFVTYKVIYGHYLNGLTYKTDIATFVRSNGNRMSIKDIFTCDENTIKKLMFNNLPKDKPCDLKSANDIKIVSVGINRKSIDVVGSFFKDNTTIFEIPFEDAAEYLTDNAYKMHGAIVKNKGTFYSDKGPASWLDNYFIYLLRKNSVSYGKYHNINANKEFFVQIDKKYDFDKDGVLKSKNPKDKLYFEVPSDDDNKEAYVEFSKSSAKDFIDDLQDQLKEFLSWKKKMESQKYAKYKLEDRDKEEINAAFYRKGDNTYGYEEKMDYSYQYTYFKKLGEAALVMKGIRKPSDSQKQLDLGSIGNKNLKMDLLEDNLSGWSLVLEQPEKEIPEICKAIQSCIDLMK